jgi:hypothetical protein
MDNQGGRKGKVHRKELRVGALTNEGWDLTQLTGHGLAGTFANPVSSSSGCAPSGGRRREGSTNELARMFLEPSGSAWPWWIVPEKDDRRGSNCCQTNCRKTLLIG